jgi:CRISPR-associated protein Cmr4
MSKFRIGYLYSLAPIHCGGEGDLGNILDSVREVHTNFPYIPGSSLRGCVRDEVKFSQVDETEGKIISDRLFGQELDTSTGTMGVHQAWFGDARLLWIPMRTIALEEIGDAFTWVSCHSLVRDHALVTGQNICAFPNHPVGTRTGAYWVADSQIKVEAMSDDQKRMTALSTWASSLTGEVKSIWEKNRIVLSDSDFEVLMEHALWTQIRNKITDDQKTEGKTQPGSAEVFWTDICIPRDTILYFPWGYRLLKNNPVTQGDHLTLMSILKGLLQVGGQANVGRGWTQSWVADDSSPIKKDGQISSVTSSGAEIAASTGV